ncbi:MAG: translation initiation factor IF-2 [Alkalispirochaeta sp.]
MSEEDKQKPKATLIKKKSDSVASGTQGTDSSATGDKKKVRVVVKRKPKSKVTTKRKSSISDEKAAAEKRADRQTPAAPGEVSSRDGGEQSEQRPASDELVAKTPAPQDEPARPGKPDTPTPASSDSDAPERSAKAEPGSSEPPTESTEAAPPKGRRREEARTRETETDRPAQSERPTKSEGTVDTPPSPGLAWSNAKPTGKGRIHTPEHRRPPLPSSMRERTGRPRTAGGEDTAAGPRRGAPDRRPGAPAENRGPGGAGRGPGAGRPGGPGAGRPGGPGRPGPTGRGPAGQRPAQGEPPADETDKRGTQAKSPGKRFYKSKKGRGGGYDRDDRQREKEISFNRKKPQPKANPVPKEIDIMEVVTVSELAKKMNLKANELIGKLMSMGMMVTINQQIDRETAEILAAEYGCTVNVVSLYDETLIETESDTESDLVDRPPIVTVMGHVDHGKTKLLDAIRSTDVVAGEHGGITQHIGAYQVTVEGGSITFLDTPGHEAFTLMRARGAQVTDIVILVVAANDGVMPQTREAINHAKEAGVPIIVAINKVDLPEANIDRVKQQLSELELIPEEWGGQTAMVEVSALKKEGIEDLLETVLLQAEVLELKANYNRRAEGKVIESRIDPGRGTVASVLIERGTLRVGDSFVAGIFAGKVRAMFNDRGERVDAAGPSMPVEILGFDGVPDSGDPFQVTEDDKSARQIGAKRQELKRVEEAKNVKKVTLDNLYDSIQDGEIQELKVVIKGDVHGSVEALQSALEKLSTPEIRLVAIHASAGAINEGDVMLASASNALVVGFHVRPTPRAQQLAEREKVEIKKYSIIYDAVEDIRAAMEGMLAPELQEETIGAVEVRETFKVPKIGIVAGCYVTEGKVQRKANVRVFRDNVQIHEGTISSLKRFKDDVREVVAGYECGIGISNLQDVQVGDTLEIYVVKEVAKRLST